MRKRNITDTCKVGRIRMLLDMLLLYTMGMDRTIMQTTKAISMETNRINSKKIKLITTKTQTRKMMKMQQQLQKLLSSMRPPLQLLQLVTLWQGRFILVLSV